MGYTYRDKKVGVFVRFSLRLQEFHTADRTIVSYQKERQPFLGLLKKLGSKR
jgi:hypothetical protein